MTTRFRGAGVSRRSFFRSTGAVASASAAQLSTIPEKLVVLSFDDAVLSHRTIAAPLLKEFGFAATFFVTHRWMADRQNFMTWDQIAELHAMGFEIGNHSWTHDSFAIPRNAARLAGELTLVEYELKRVGVPKPISFAWCGNTFGPEAIRVIGDHGYRLARRGINPESDSIAGGRYLGPAYSPTRHHPLLIPSTAVPDPCWTIDDFKRALAVAGHGEIAVLQFHGTPDLAHPWVHTPPDRFRTFMEYLKNGGYRVIAVRDLLSYADVQNPPADRLTQTHVPELRSNCGVLPIEMAATRQDLGYWVADMNEHGFNETERTQMTGLPAAELARAANTPAQDATRDGTLRILPYPGGRHPRIGFLEGAIDPMRGTKASVFLPEDRSSYVVVDLPEAIFSNTGLIFLAHTHIPTVWNQQNQIIENIDWIRNPDASLSFRRQLPNGIQFGASIRPAGLEVQMELWLRNVTYTDLSALRTQVCVMLKGAHDFNTQTNQNKVFTRPAAAVRSADQSRWIVTAWEHCGRTWGNDQVPCMHADPVFPDCPAGQTVRVRGKLWFYEGKQIEGEIERANALLNRTRQ
jgi:peptidoglycan/xylan/chitin deacetylase (PgdA/CDA1 family)